MWTGGKLVKLVAIEDALKRRASHEGVELLDIQDLYGANPPIERWLDWSKYILNRMLIIIFSSHCFLLRFYLEHISTLQCSKKAVTKNLIIFVSYFSDQSTYQFKTTLYLQL